MLVRWEPFGPLIWSTKRLQYFTIVDNSLHELFSQAVDARLCGVDEDSCLKKLPTSFIDELYMLGFDEPLSVRRPNTQYLSAPLDAYFDYTSNCNLTCGYCYDSESKPLTMSALKIEHLIGSLAEWGVMRLHLAGGEPTINKHLLSLYLGAANHHGLGVSMATNGTLFDEQISRCIIENNVRTVSFSIDSLDKEINDKHRGSGSFERAVNGLRLFRQIRDSCGGATKIGIKPVIFPGASYEFLEKIVKFAISEHVDILKFQNPERCLNHEEGYYGNLIDKYYETVVAIRNLTLKYHKRIKIKPICNPVTECVKIGVPGMLGCIGARELIAIDASGNLSPCLMNKTSLGHINDWDSLSEFWGTSPKLQNYRERSSSNDDCITCTLLPYCRGGSHVRAMVESGDSKKAQDPMCPVRYMDRHKSVLQSCIITPREFVHFEVVNVLHSL